MKTTSTLFKPTLGTCGKERTPAPAGARASIHVDVLRRGARKLRSAARIEAAQSCWDLRQLFYGSTVDAYAD